MTIVLDKAHFENRIASCERNIAEVEAGPYTPAEKEALIRIYKGTIRRAKRDLMSFYPTSQN